MKKSLLIVVVCVLGLGLLLAACGGGPAPSGPTPIGGVKSDSGGGSRGGGPANFVTLKNTNDFEICQAFVSPTSQDTWGQNILAAGETYAPGATLTLTKIASGNYDLKVLNCDGSKQAIMQFTMP